MKKKLLIDALIIAAVATIYALVLYYYPIENDGVLFGFSIAFMAAAALTVIFSDIEIAYKANNESTVIAGVFKYALLASPFLSYALATWTGKLLWPAIVFLILFVAYILILVQLRLSKKATEAYGEKSLPEDLLDKQKGE